VEARTVDAEQTLSSVPLFREFQPKQLKSLAKWTATRNYEPGQVIVREGDLGMGLYCIQSGTVKVTQNTPSGPRDIRTMGPGESFGELALLDSMPRSSTVTAVDWTTAILLDKAQFLAELRTYPEIALNILPVLVQWLREADRRISELT
jgi:CRP-like cAMP-binding protein